MTATLIRLGVNIDHVATLRQARGVRYPDPLQAALLAQQAGADGITLHLREDRRHIQDRDVELAQLLVQVPVNLEMAATEEMLSIAESAKPQHCCIVPEKREELTTEGGLDVLSHETHLTTSCERLAAGGINGSVFIDPEKNQIDAAVRTGAPTIELHTGAYAEACSFETQRAELAKLQKAAEYASHLGLTVNAGHGLHYHNVQPIAAIPTIHELNIGHSIIARAVFSGIEAAVSEMKTLMVQARLQPDAVVANEMTHKATEADQV